MKQCFKARSAGWQQAGILLSVHPLYGCFAYDDQADMTKSVHEADIMSFYQAVIEIVLDYFFTERAIMEVERILQRQYAHFSEMERREIFLRVKNLLDSPDDSGFYKKLAREKMRVYLYSHQRLHVTGFLRFRLKNYREFLEQVVRKAVESYVEMAEYQEFVRILQYFVAMNPPYLAMVHVVCHSEKYVLLDEQGQRLAEDSIALLGEDAANPPEDLLISTLINLAPEKIIFHQCEADTAASIIKLARNIFQENLTFCGGCRFCNEGLYLDSDLT